MAEETVEMAETEGGAEVEEKLDDKTAGRGGRAPRGRAPRGRVPRGGARAGGRGRAPPKKEEGGEEKPEDGSGGGEKLEEGAGGEDDKPGGQKQQIIVKKFNAVAKWTQDTGSHTHCAICRNNLMDLCIEAHGSGKGCDEQNGTCLIAVGVCQHHFHNCCLSRFLKDHSTCPACGGRDWVLHHLDKQV